MLAFDRPFALAPQFVRRKPASIAAAVIASLLFGAAQGTAQEAGAGVYVRTDNDRTTVITPRLHVGTPLGESTRVDLVYTVDVWTSASIDIRTSASLAIDAANQQGVASEVAPITEQRDEIDVTAAQELGDLNLSAGYRYSTEPDYESHGGSLGLGYDLADNSATVELSLTATFDDVGRAGDPGFTRAARTLSVRLGFTQILDPHMLVQAIYELGHSSGFQSSPYRFVGFGTANGTCRGPVMFCLPEANPDQRLRHALALRGRRALGDAFAIGAGYRFYLDDWELLSHTIMADLSLSPGLDTLLSLRYRFYVQSGAAHYSANFATLEQAGSTYTHDKELSPFSSHRISLDLDHAFALDDLGNILRVLFSAGPTLYQYTDFPLYDRINAFEVTLALAVEL